MPRSATDREPGGNELLAALSTQEYELLRPHLKRITLTFGDILYEPGDTIRHVYFPNSGVVSLLSLVEDRSPLEVGMVGNEGIVGLPVFLGAKKSINRALVQGGGTAMRMTNQAFRKQVGNDGTLPHLLRRYTLSLLAQISQTAACNRFHSLEARLARWLLMSQDRIRSDEFLLTQKFLSDMLGVRREGVTAAARSLQHAKLIRYVRGRIKILNRAGLEAASCKCYEIVQSEKLNSHRHF